MNMPLVSIIVPVFNAELYLDRCLRSIARQTWKAIEVILIDDGSTDQSLALMKNFAMNDHRFYVYSQQNKGPSAARNEGLCKATGQYFMFVDADDYIELDAVENMVRPVLNLKNAMVLCDNIEIWDGRQETRVLFTEDVVGRLKQKEVMSAIASGRAGLVCGKLISANIVKEHCIKFDENIQMCEDQVFFLEVAANASAFFYVNRSLYYYDRRNENSVTLRYKTGMFETQLIVQGRLKEIYVKHSLITESSSQILSQRFKSIIWSCIQNETVGLRLMNLRTRIRNVNRVLVNPNVQGLLPSIHPQNLEERMMIWALRMKLGALALMVQLVKEKLYKSIHKLLRIERRRLEEDVRH